MHCSKQFRYAFSPDNPDNLILHASITLIVLALIALALLVPQLGYVGTLIAQPNCPGDTACPCLYRNVSYSERYTPCIMPFFTLMCVLAVPVLVGFLIYFLYYVVRKDWPLLCNEYHAAQATDDENVALLAPHHKQFSLRWLISPNNPNRLFQSGSVARRYAVFLGVISVLILLLTVAFPIGKGYASLVCQGMNVTSGECTITVLQCSSAPRIMSSKDCGFVGIVAEFVLMCGGVVLYLLLNILYPCFCRDIRAAIKKPEEIDEQIALKVMAKAII